MPTHSELKQLFHSCQVGQGQNLKYIPPALLLNNWFHFGIWNKAMACWPAPPKPHIVTLFLLSKHINSQRHKDTDSKHINPPVKDTKTPTIQHTNKKTHSFVETYQHADTRTPPHPNLLSKPIVSPPFGIWCSRPVRKILTRNYGWRLVTEMLICALVEVELLQGWWCRSLYLSKLFGGHYNDYDDHDHEVGDNYDNYDDDDDYKSAVSVHCIVHPADRGFVQWKFSPVKHLRLLPQQWAWCSFEAPPLAIQWGEASKPLLHK